MTLTKIIYIFFGFQKSRINSFFEFNCYFIGNLLAKENFMRFSYFRLMLDLK